MRKKTSEEGQASIVNNLFNSASVFFAPRQPHCARVCHVCCRGQVFKVVAMVIRPVPIFMVYLLTFWARAKKSLSNQPMNVKEARAGKCYLPISAAVGLGLQDKAR